MGRPEPAEALAPPRRLPGEVVPAAVEVGAAAVGPVTHIITGAWSAMLRKRASLSRSAASAASGRSCRRRPPPSRAARRPAPRGARRCRRGHLGCRRRSERSPRAAHHLAARRALDGQSSAQARARPGTGPEVAQARPGHPDFDMFAVLAGDAQQLARRRVAVDEPRSAVGLQIATGAASSSPGRHRIGSAVSRAAARPPPPSRPRCCAPRSPCPRPRPRRRAPGSR